jgi:hypothetical protein
MKGQVASILIVLALVVGASVGYFTGAGNSTTKTTTATTTATATITESPTGAMTYQVINPNVTVRGQAAGTPCGALEFPCATFPNQTTTAVLIRFGGAYYYLSYYGTFNKLRTTETLSGGVLSNTWYTIIYDNSTVYCVSPKVQWWNACPPSVIVTPQVDTYLTSCTITGIGGFEFRVVSDSTRAPISGETIEAVDRLGGCGQNQVVYLYNFSKSQGSGGWLVPDFPNQATPAGQLSFTVSYQSGTYNFATDIPPIGTNCVTLHVPSGNVTGATVMNGICS